MLSPLADSAVLAQQEGNGLVTLVIMALALGAVMYMTVIPQRRQRQRHADMLRRLDVGDEVVTTGGIVGVITHVEDDLFHIEVDTDVVVRVAKPAVARSTSEPDPAEKPASQRKGLLGGLVAPKGAAGADTATKDAAGGE